MRIYRIGDFYNNYEPIGTALFRICHINLAKGFRGGERQTELLIRAIGAFEDVSQTAILRKDSPLIDRLDGSCPRLDLHVVSKPYIRYAFLIRNCSLVHAHEAKAAQFAYLSSRLYRRPYLITRRVPNPIKSNPLSRRIYVKSNRVVALSGAIRDLLVKYDSRLKPVIIPSMVSNLPFDPVSKDEIRRRFAGKFLVGHAGALVNRHKGQQFLIEAARTLQNDCPEIHFLLLGNGEDERWLRSQAIGLSNVTFEGFRENLGDYLAAFDLFVFPSLQEGLGSVLLDAMQFRLPIVASNVDGIPDIIEHAKNGMLVPPGNAAALVMAIKALYYNGQMRKVISENGYSESIRYQPRAIAERYLSIYQEIITFH